MDEDYALKDSLSLFLSYLLTTPSLYFVFNSLKPLDANFLLFTFCPPVNHYYQGVSMHLVT